MYDENEITTPGVRFMQAASLTYMWIFFLAISIWILNLLALSFQLQDSFEATVAIGLIAIPVYLTLACVLTYVFVGLRREERRLSKKRRGE